MPKYKIYPQVETNKILNYLPKFLFGLVDLSLIKQNPVDLVVFASDRWKKTVLPGHVRALIKNLDSNSTIVVVAEVINPDAMNILKKITPYVFYWDAPY